MKLATGTKLICPKCLGVLMDRPNDVSPFMGTDSTVRMESVCPMACASSICYAECACGLCMFCQWTPDGWEYRVML